MKFSSALAITLLGTAIGVSSAIANTSPSEFATVTPSGPLNQSSTDDINGQLTTSSHAPEQGNLAWLTDATDSSTPSDSVIFPTNTVSLSWDFGGDAEVAAQRRLDTVSIWVAADEQRVGFNGWLATSLDGVTYTEIPGSRNNNLFVEAGGTRSGFHHLLYDFTGTNVSNFRFLQLNTEGYSFVPGDPTFQPLIVEIDATVSIPEPSTLALLVAGAGVLGVSMFRRKS